MSKGSGRRPTNQAAFNSNFDAIFNKKPQIDVSGIHHITLENSGELHIGNRIISLREPSNMILGVAVKLVLNKGWLEPEYMDNPEWRDTENEEMRINPPVVEEHLFTLPAPYRHHHVLRGISKLNLGFSNFFKYTDIQGFYSEQDKFLTREEAFILATKNSQIIEKSGNPHSTELFSEDVW